MTIQKTLVSDHAE